MFEVQKTQGAKISHKLETQFNRRAKIKREER